jgi:HK97 family phage prohead protease
MLHSVEMREAPDPGDGTVGFRTYASITEHAYDMWDMFGPYTETIASTAFDETLAAQPDVAFLLNHGGMTLARTASGTLELGADDTGMWYEPRLDPQNSVVRDVMSGVRRGDLNESSFAFRIIRGSWSPDWTAYRIEQVDIDRGDVSIVNYGANPATGDVAIALGLAGDDVDVDALDDSQALALSAALEQRTQRRAAAERSAHTTAATMSRAELDALAELAAPHPLAVQNRTGTP